LLQVAQLDELQPAQPPLPLMGAISPEELVVKQAKRESTLLALPLHVGQSAGSEDLLNGRISSNFFVQSSQTYS
jgi:hypothetical protein